MAGSSKAVHANTIRERRTHRVDPVTASANANADSYAYRNTNTYTHAHGYTDSYSCGNAYANTDGYAESYALPRLRPTPHPRPTP